MITPAYRYENWTQGTRKIQVSDDSVQEITRRESADVVNLYTFAGGFVANVFAEEIADAGGVPGLAGPFHGAADFTSIVSRAQDERDSPRVTRLTLRMATTFAQNLGTPDPTEFTFDVRVDGVSVLTAPVVVAAADDVDVEVNLPLASSFIVNGITRFDLYYKSPWIGDEFSGEWAPGWTDLTLEVTLA